LAKTATKKKLIKTSGLETQKKGHSPNWEGCESWDSDQFTKYFRESMQYYNLEFTGKDLKPAVLKWMSSVDYTKEEIAAFKKTKDWRSNSTMGALASCLLKGMTPQRNDFNFGRDTAAWLKGAIARVVEEGQGDIDDADQAEVKSATLQPSIQDRTRESAFKMTDDIEDAIYNFQTDPDAFDPKEYKVLNSLKGKEAKAAHARIIRDYYIRQFNELEELGSTDCEQLKEAYSHLSKAQIKKLHTLYHEIVSACTMLMQEAKVNRAPRAKKAQPKEKVVAKLKYKKSDEPLKLVSINPTDIIGSKELWVYNTKTRKLGRYVADDFSDLGVKGTTITGFNEHNSIQKTIRKPEEKLKEFKSAGKVQLRKFLDGINATDTKMNGRINEETILLRVA
jgi:hypothetical protein